MSKKIIEMIGKGDPKATLLNCAENIQPNEDLFILIRKADGSYVRYNTEISHERLCGMLDIMGRLVDQSWGDM